MALKLERYIKNSQGTKVEQATTSINLEKRQLDFLRENKINVSALFRDFVEQLIKENKK
jgi:hypothetical protein